MSDKQQYFLAFADRSIARPVKARMRAAEKRGMHRAQKKAMIKALNERDLLVRLWKKYRQETYRGALEGPYHKQIQELVDLLNQLNLKTQNQLLKKAKTWQKIRDRDIRFLMLRLIDARLIVLREQAELPPFDDGLLGEPLTLFQQLRQIIDLQTIREVYPNAS